MLKVYFISGMDARVNYGGGNEVLVPRDEYLHVCDIESCDPEDAFHALQNVDTFWHESDRGHDVKLSRWGKELVRLNGAVRSMMVGDIVSTIEDGEVRYFLCAICGFVEVWLGEDEHFHLLGKLDEETLEFGVW